jgi:hypothetical protein
MYNIEEMGTSRQKTNVLVLMLKKLIIMGIDLSGAVATKMRQQCLASAEIGENITLIAASV